MSTSQGWATSPLGNLMVQKNDKAKQVKSTEYATVGTYPIVDQSSDFICGYHDDSRKVINNNLPLTVFGDHTRHTKFISFPFIVGADGTQLLKPKQEIEDKFFYYLVSRAAERIGNYGYDRHFKHLKEYVSEFPTSKPEQSKIAEILSAVDRAIEQTEALIAKQQRIKTGLMQDLLTRGIDEHGNLRSEQTHEFKDSPLGRIPVGWDVKKIGEVFEIQLGKMLSQKAMEGVSSFHYLGNINVQWDRVDTTELPFMDFNERERRKFELKPGDILVCEGGEVGRTAIWRGEDEGCYYQKAIHRLRAINQQYLPDLFPRFMRWGIRKGLLSDFTSQTSIAHLTQEKLAVVPIMVPTMNEQIQLCAALDQLDSVLYNQSARLTKLRAIKTALMQDLLTGKRRVTSLIEMKEAVS